MSGNVSVRFSVQDQEVVKKALEQLGADGEAALRKIDAASQQPSKALSLLSATVETARSRLMGLAVPLGPVGSALVAMGPAGLVAAAGIGGAITALQKMSSLSDELAAKAQKLTTFAELTGLSTDKIQAISGATQQFGKTQDETISAIERSTVAWEQLKRGQGEAYDQIRRISPELLAQLASARDAGQALDILAQAYDRAETAAQKLSLARAFFGRGGASTGSAILAAIAEAGGSDALTREAKKAGDTIDKELLERLNKLKVQTDEIRDRYKNTFTALFSEREMQQQKEVAEDVERIVNGIKYLKELVSNWGGGASQVGLVKESARIAGEIASIEAQIANGRDSRFIQAKRKRLFEDYEKALAAEAIDASSIVPKSEVFLPKPRPAEADEKPKKSIEFELREQRDLVAALGAAATPTEQLKLRTLELAAATKTLLLSEETVARIRNSNNLAIAQTIDSTRQRLGIASEEQIVAVRLAELEDARAKGFIRNADEMMRAEALVRAEAKATADALAIRNAEFKGLKALELDASNLGRTIDELGTNQIQNLSSAFVDSASGARSLDDVLKNLRTNAIQTFTQMIAKMVIMAPLARALQAALSGVSGGLFGGGTGGTASTISVGGQSFPSFTASADGNVFSGPGISSFSRSVVSRPTVFPFANGIGLMGEAGEEGIFPLTRINGKLGIRAAGASGGGVTINNYNAPAMESQRSTRDANGNVTIDQVFKKMIEQTGVESIASGDMGRAISTKFGVKPFAGQ